MARHKTIKEKTVSCLGDDNYKFSIIISCLLNIVVLYRLSGGVGAWLLKKYTSVGKRFDKSRLKITTF